LLLSKGFFSSDTVQLEVMGAGWKSLI